VGHQAQRLLLAHPSDQNRRTTGLQRLRNAQGLSQVVVLAVEGAVVRAPHLPADAQGLLQALEAFGHRRKGHAEPCVFALVPSRADTQQCSSSGQDVQRGEGLGEQTRMAVGDAGDEQAQLQSLRLACQIAESGVAVEHRVVGRSHRLHLEPMVHQRQGGEASLLGGSGGRGQARCDGGRGTKGREVGDVQGQFHGGQSFGEATGVLCQELYE